MRVQTAQEAFVAALFILQNQGTPDPIGGLDDDETGCVHPPLGTWAVPQQLRGPAGWLCPGGQDTGLGFVISRDVTLLLGEKKPHHHVVDSSARDHQPGHSSHPWAVVWAGQRGPGRPAALLLLFWGLCNEDTTCYLYF